MWYIQIKFYKTILVSKRKSFILNIDNVCKIVILEKLSNTPLSNNTDPLFLNRIISEILLILNYSKVLKYLKPTRQRARTFVR